MSDEKIPGPVRSHAGDYLEVELQEKLMGPLPAAFAGVGSLVAAALAAWVGLGSAVVLGAACIIGSLLLWVLHSRRIGNLRKGYVAERQIGRAIEQAITADNCAVAHNVEGIANAGDIDHIVATPQGVWVVETKYRRVWAKSFPKVLNRIRANVARLQDLLPPDTAVSGCLVLAYEEGGVGGERGGVRVYNHDTFRDQFLKTLVAEKGDECVVDGRVANAVWRLSRGEAVEQEKAAAPKDGTPGSPIALGKVEPDDPDEIRRRFPNAWERWSAEDDQELWRLHAAGWSDSRLSGHFGRRPNAIRSRLRKVGGD